MKKLSFGILGLFLSVGALQADPPATHGMVLLGDEYNYISHLPMFHAPHDYQVIAEVRLLATPRSNTLTYYEQLKKEGQKFFTLQPERFDLKKLINGEIQNFSAQLYKDHFERGGSPLGIVNVQIKKILLAEQLNPEKATPSRPEYFLFGQAGEYFAAHLIGGRPSFDALLEVEQAYDKFCGRAECSEPLAINDEQLPIQLTYHLFFDGPDRAVPTPGEFLGRLNGVQATVKDVVYEEFSELEH